MTIKEGTGLDEYVVVAEWPCVMGMNPGSGRRLILTVGEDRYEAHMKLLYGSDGTYAYGIDGEFRLTSVTPTEQSNRS